MNPPTFQASDVRATGWRIIEASNAVCRAIYRLLCLTGGLLYATFPDGLPESLREHLEDPYGLGRSWGATLSSHYYRAFPGSTKTPRFDPATRRLLQLIFGHLISMYAVNNDIMRDSVKIRPYAADLYLPICYPFRLLRRLLGYNDHDAIGQLMERWTWNGPEMSRVKELLEICEGLEHHVAALLGVDTDSGGTREMDGAGRATDEARVETGRGPGRRELELGTAEESRSAWDSGTSGSWEGA